MPQPLAIPERYEFKYVIPEARARALVEAVAPFCKMDEHAALAPDHQYQIYSLYLDTPGFEFYRAKQWRQKRRLKLRIRSYGASDGPVLYEVKRKIGRIVIKSRVFAARENWRQRLLQPLAADASPSERDFRALMDRTGARPVLLVRYAREAYVSMVDSYARITVDRQIAFQACADWELDGDPGRWIAGEGRAAGGSRVVLELKCTTSVPLWMMALARRFDLQRTGFSKYCTGVERLWGRQSTRRGDERVAVWA
ncbi:MAG: polyphosphate polymerase domain-containing protein [Deltaproteobacteria bacterium]|nr:polyphosphate polymerase domain-containing protein [Deltaproteobacteria bacterium]